MEFKPDADFQFHGLERWVLDLLAVPRAPELPDGSAESIRVFRAGENYYRWSVLAWAARALLLFAGLASTTVAVMTRMSDAPGWVRAALDVLVSLAWIVFLIGLLITFIARRLNYRLHWYIVTDRSLRIRSGVFQIDELTMTYGNIQEIRVAAGPLQKLLGLADVEVHAAGGGRGETKGSSGHVGRFEGLSNANAIRDLLLERLRRYHDSGLGEAPLEIASSESDSLAAAKMMLEEARALREVASSSRAISPQSISPSPTAPGSPAL